jgi:hypothetical protein
MTTNNYRFRRPEHSEIQHRNMKFLITDQPRDSSIDRYIEVKKLKQIYSNLFTFLTFLFAIKKELKRYGANVVVRVCEPTYNSDKLKECGIKVVVIIKFF